MELLNVLTGYAFLAAVYYAGVVYPILWFRRTYRIVRRHRVAHA